MGLRATEHVWSQVRNTKGSFNSQSWHTCHKLNIKVIVGFGDGYIYQQLITIFIPNIHGETDLTLHYSPMPITSTA